MSETALAKFNGVELARHRRTLLQNTLFQSGFFAFVGIYLATLAAVSGASFEGVVTSGFTLLAIFATVSIALHMPIWSMRLRTDNSASHLRAAHLYVFTAVGIIMGGFSCVTAGVMTVSAFISTDENSVMAQALSAVGAWVLAITLCLLGASSQAVAFDDVIDTMAEHDRRQKNYTVARRANRIAARGAGLRNQYLGRPRLFGLAALYGLVIAFLTNVPAFLIVDNLPWYLFFPAIIFALISVALIYMVYYSLAVRWGPEIFMSISVLLAWVAVAGISAYVSAEDWGEFAAYWYVLFAPLLFVVLHTSAGWSKLWGAGSARVRRKAVRWSLRPLIRASVEREQTKYSPPRARIRLC